MNFTIPRRHCSDLERVEPERNSRDWNAVMSTVLRSLSDRQSKLFSHVHKVELIQNKQLEKRMDTWRKEKRDEYSYKTSELSNVEGFVAVGCATADSLVKFGVCTEYFSMKTTCRVGSPQLGVNVFQHADDAWNVAFADAGWTNCFPLQLVVLHIVRGRCFETRCKDLQPQPNYDCHVGRCKFAGSACEDGYVHMRYIYDFDPQDLSLLSRPRQVQPFAVVTLAKSNVELGISELIQRATPSPRFSSIGRSNTESKSGAVPDATPRNACDASQNLLASSDGPRPLNHSLDGSNWQASSGTTFQFAPYQTTIPGLATMTPYSGATPWTGQYMTKQNAVPSTVAPARRSSLVDPRRQASQHAAEEAVFNPCSSSPSQTPTDKSSLVDPRQQASQHAAEEAAFSPCSSSPSQTPMDRSSLVDPRQQASQHAAEEAVLSSPCSNSPPPSPTDRDSNEELSQGGSEWQGNVVQGDTCLFRMKLRANSVQAARELSLISATTLTIQGRSFRLSKLQQRIPAEVWQITDGSVFRRNPWSLCWLTALPATEADKASFLALRSSLIKVQKAAIVLLDLHGYKSSKLFLLTDAQDVDESQLAALLALQRDSAAALTIGPGQEATSSRGSPLYSTAMPHASYAGTDDEMLLNCSITSLSYIETDTSASSVCHLPVAVSTCHPEDSRAEIILSGTAESLGTCTSTNTACTSGAPRHCQLSVEMELSAARSSATPTPDDFQVYDHEETVYLPPSSHSQGHDTSNAECQNMWNRGGDLSAAAMNKMDDQKALDVTATSATMQAILSGTLLIQSANYTAETRTLPTVCEPWPAWPKGTSATAIMSPSFCSTPNPSYSDASHASAESKSVLPGSPLTCSQVHTVTPGEVPQSTLLMNAVDFPTHELYCSAVSDSPLIASGEKPRGTVTVCDPHGCEHELALSFSSLGEEIDENDGTSNADSGDCFLERTDLSLDLFVEAKADSIQDLTILSSHEVEPMVLSSSSSEAIVAATSTNTILPERLSPCTTIVSPVTSSLASPAANLKPRTLSETKKKIYQPSLAAAKSADQGNLRFVPFRIARKAVAPPVKPAGLAAWHDSDDSDGSSARHPKLTETRQGHPRHSGGSMRAPLLPVVGRNSAALLQDSATTCAISSCKCPPSDADPAFEGSNTGSGAKVTAGAHRGALKAGGAAKEVLYPVSTCAQSLAGTDELEKGDAQCTVAASDTFATHLWGRSPQSGHGEPNAETHSRPAVQPTGPIRSCSDDKSSVRVPDISDSDPYSPHSQLLPLCFRCSVPNSPFSFQDSIEYDLAEGDVSTPMSDFKNYLNSQVSQSNSRMSTYSLGEGGHSNFPTLPPTYPTMFCSDSICSETYKHTAVKRRAVSDSDPYSQCDGFSPEGFRCSALNNQLWLQYPNDFECDLSECKQYIGEPPHKFGYYSSSRLFQSNSHLHTDPQALAESGYDRPPTSQNGLPPGGDLDGQLVRVPQCGTFGLSLLASTSGMVPAVDNSSRCSSLGSALERHCPAPLCHKSEGKPDMDATDKENVQPLDSTVATARQSASHRLSVAMSHSPSSCKYESSIQSWLLNILPLDQDMQKSIQHPDVTSLPSAGDDLSTLSNSTPSSIITITAKDNCRPYEKVVDGTMLCNGAPVCLSPRSLFLCQEENYGPHMSTPFSPSSCDAPSNSYSGSTLSHNPDCSYCSGAHYYC